MIIALVMGVLTFFSAYFSCSETTYTGMNTIRVKNLALEGKKNAEKALAIHENYDKLLTTILVGNNVVNVAISTLGTMLFSELFGAAWGVIIATVFTATVILIFGEITPKTLAKRNSERYALKLAGSLSIILTILTPITWAFMKLTNLVSRNAKNDSAESPSFTEDELYVMIDEIEEEGTLEKSESDLIKSAMQFDDINVSEMYTPRANITAVDMETTVEDMKNIFIESEYSRIPVYEGSIDRIIGAVYSRDFFFAYVEGKEFTVSDIMRPVKFVPENTSIATLLTDLQKSRIHMAIVLDNFGRTLGLVSMEDVLEELVGDIWDESDEVGYPLVEEKDGSFTVPGEANIFDVMGRIGVGFEPGDFEGHSISAFISNSLDRVPRRGDVVDTENTKILVRSMKSRSVKEARIFPIKGSEDQEGTQGN